MPVTDRSSTKLRYGVSGAEIWNLLPQIVNLKSLQTCTETWYSYLLDQRGPVKILSLVHFLVATLTSCLRLYVILRKERY